LKNGSHNVMAFAPSSQRLRKLDEIAPGIGEECETTVDDGEVDCSLGKVA
jgi:hypothetical protein